MTAALAAWSISQARADHIAARTVWQEKTGVWDVVRMEAQDRTAVSCVWGTNWNRRSGELVHRMQIEFVNARGQRAVFLHLIDLSDAPLDRMRGRTVVLELGELRVPVRIEIAERNSAEATSASGRFAPEELLQAMGRAQTQGLVRFPGGVTWAFSTRGFEDSFAHMERCLNEIETGRDSPGSTPEGRSGPRTPSSRGGGGYLPDDE